MSTRNDRLSPVARSAAMALGIAAFVGLSGLALAQSPQTGFGPPAFGTIDLDGDGQVSADEFSRHRAQRMAARAAEGRPMRNAASAPTFESLDRDGNGYLSATEVTNAQQERFASRGPGYGRGAGAGGRPCWRSW